MRLAEYLEREGRGSKTRLQERTGIAYSTIHWIAVGKSTPRPDTAKRIAAATDGAVSVEELLGLTSAEAA